MLPSDETSAAAAADAAVSNNVVPASAPVDAKQSKAKAKRKNTSSSLR
jgi:hypothetical protein